MACAPVEQAVTTAWFGPFRPCSDRDIAGGEIDQAPGDEERAHPARSLLGQEQRGLLDAPEAADAGADQDAGADLIL